MENADSRSGTFESRGVGRQDLRDVGREYGTTALLYAAQKGNPEVVKILLDHGADVNAKETLSGMTPVMFAAFKGHTTIVRMLLERGVTEPDAAFLPAIYFGHIETVKVLLDSKTLKP